MKAKNAPDCVIRQEYKKGADGKKTLSALIYSSRALGREEIEKLELQKTAKSVREIRKEEKGDEL